MPEISFHSVLEANLQGWVTPKQLGEETGLNWRILSKRIDLNEYKKDGYVDGLRQSLYSKEALDVIMGKDAAVANRVFRKQQKSINELYRDVDFLKQCNRKLQSQIDSMNAVKIPNN